MTDHLTYTPLKNETPENYALRIEKNGEREIVIRKGLRAHFNFSIHDAIKVCSILSDARHRELLDLRERFPQLTENRFAWRISQSLTIPKEDALIWAQTILTEEVGE